MKNSYSLLEEGEEFTNSSNKHILTHIIYPKNECPCLMMCPTLSLGLFPLLYPDSCWSTVASLNFPEHASHAPTLGLHTSCYFFLEFYSLKYINGSCPYLLKSVKMILLMILILPSPLPCVSEVPDYRQVVIHQKISWLDDRLYPQPRFITANCKE